MDQEDILIPAAALYEKSPTKDDNFIIDDILLHYMKSNKFTDYINGVKEFFIKYVALLTTDVIKLLTVYGIGMEGHLQNLIIFYINFLKNSYRKRLILKLQRISLFLFILIIYFYVHEIFTANSVI